MNLRGALGYLRGLNQVDNQMGWVYHQFQEQKCSRSAQLELIWEIPAKSEYTLTEKEELNLAGKETPYYWRVKATDAALKGIAATLVSGHIVKELDLI